MFATAGTQGIAFLTEIIIKTLVIQVIALSSLWFLRRSSAAVRHLYLSVAMLMVLAVPFATLITPAVNTGFISLPSSMQQAKAAGPVSEAPPGAPGASGDVSGGRRVVGMESQAAGRQQGAGLARVLMVVWAAGTCGFLVWLIGGLIYSAWLASKARPVRDKDLNRLLDDAKAGAGLRKDMGLLETDRIKVPVVYGVKRPKLLLPAQAKLWPKARLRAIFIHEIGHIRRHDILLQFLARLTCCIHWFNPLMWIIERRLFLASECACDDMVIDRHFEPGDYAEHLMDTSVELGTDRNPVWATAAMAEGTAFKDRILSILNPNIHRFAPRPAHVSIVIMVALVMSVPLVTFGLWEVVEHGPSGSQTASRADRARLANARRVEPTDRPGESDPVFGAGEDDDMEGWRKALEVDDLNIREHAATALGKRGDRRAVPYLVRLLDDPSASVREHAASALGNLGDARALEGLTRTMQHDPDARVREHAASALGNLGDRRAYEPLLKTLEDGNKATVRAHAAYGLGLLGDSRALEPLIKAIRDREEVIRWHAAMALGELGDERALDALSRALDDSSDRVRTEARKARSKILGGSPGQ
jgi:beta-lactamase regulating signal transducer with metallopeptidase domain